MFFITYYLKINVGYVDVICVYHEIEDPSMCDMISVEEHEGPWSIKYLNFLR